MATARGPRGAPDSGARITKDRVQLPGQRKAHGRWPACRVRHAGLRGMPMRRAGGGAARCGMRGVPAARRWPRLYHVTINHSFTGVADPRRTPSAVPASGYRAPGRRQSRATRISPRRASCNRGQSNVSSHTSYDYVQIYALSSRATSHPHLPRLGPSALPWRCVAMRAPPRVAA